MSTLTFVDFEGAVRSWCRATAQITAEVGTRTFFGVPNGTPTFPLIVVSLLAGGPQGGDHPMAAVTMTFRVWGDNKAQAAQAAAALVSAIESLPSGTLMGTGVRCLGAHVTLWLWRPDPETDRPGYVVDADFGFIAV